MFVLRKTYRYNCQVSIYFFPFSLYTDIFKWPDYTLKHINKYKLQYLGLIQNGSCSVPSRQRIQKQYSVDHILAPLHEGVMTKHGEMKLETHYPIKNYRAQSNKLVSRRDKWSLSTCITHAKPQRACKAWCCGVFQKHMFFQATQKLWKRKFLHFEL